MPPNPVLFHAPQLYPILRPRTLAYSAALFPILFLISQPYLPTSSPNHVVEPSSPNLVAEPHRRTLSPNLGPRTTDDILRRQSTARNCGPHSVAHELRHLLCAGDTMDPTLCGRYHGSKVRREPWTLLCAGDTMDPKCAANFGPYSVREIPWIRTLDTN